MWTNWCAPVCLRHRSAFQGSARRITSTVAIRIAPKGLKPAAWQPRFGSAVRRPSHRDDKIASMFAFPWSPRAVVTYTLIAAAAGVAAACGGRPEASPASAADPKAPRPVKVTAAIESQMERVIAVTGTLAAEDQVTVSFKVTGRLDSLDVDLGSSVAKGQSIGRLTPTDFQLRVTQADAALQQARARLGLDAQGSDDTVDISKAALVRQ